MQNCDETEDLITEDDVAQFSPGERAKVTRNGSIYPLGRARDNPEFVFNWESLKCFEGCGCPRSKAFPSILPSGNVYLCDNSAFRVRDKTNPMVLGNAFKTPLSDILQRAKEDPLLSAMTSGGFSRLLNVVRSAGLGHKLKEAYVQPCDLCVHLLEIRGIERSIAESLLNR